MSVLGIGHNSECNWLAAGLTAFKLGSSEFNDENPESCKNLCSNTLYNHTYTKKMCIPKFYYYPFLFGVAFLIALCSILT